MDNFWNDKNINEFAELHLQEALKNIHPFKEFTKYTTPESFKASKQPVKDWEVLTYINPNIITDVPNGNIEKPSGYAFLRKYPIHSVRLLSEVFTVGDNVYYETEKDQYKFQIKSFYIKGNNMMASQHEGDTWGVNISILKKVKEPLPLFITEDGVKLFPNDTVWIIELPSYNLVRCLKIDGVKLPNQLYFSTKEKAEEYILRWKPCLSMWQVLNCLEEDCPSIVFDKLKSALTNIVKSKL